MLSELASLASKNRGSVDEPEADSDGDKDSPLVHAHACLSAAARLVSAVHAGDAHGVHLALADHHEAHRKLMGYDAEE
ncbi:MAG TPA: hypothetical protein VMI75_29635 [Polyangiaceae bacterium]|nr:hypothetical protein [Polyangiaceae bacterium]